MCFSPTASFVAAGALAAAGTITVARRANARSTMFAVMPLLFAAQQASEGVVWLTVDSPSHTLVRQAATYVFLTFAFVVWPTWVPIAMLRDERSPSHRRVLAAISWFGAAVSLATIVMLAHWVPAAQVDEHSITYTFGVATGAPAHVLMLVMYAVPTVVPLFVSTATLARPLGVLMVAGAGLAMYVRHEAVTSVWCFFAAVVSAMILWAIERDRVGVARAPV
jgi:hypothetical protein